MRHAQTNITSWLRQVTPRTNTVTIAAKAAFRDQDGDVQDNSDHVTRPTRRTLNYEVKSTKCAIRERGGEFVRCERIHSGRLTG